jgi:hypothetical protein
MTTYIIAHNIEFPKSLSCPLSLSPLVGDRRFVIPACPESPASFLKERFPTSGNDKTCPIIYDSVFRYPFFSHTVILDALIPELRLWKERLPENPHCSRNFM